MTLEIFDAIRMTVGIVCIILGLALSFLCITTAVVTIDEWRCRKKPAIMLGKTITLSLACNGSKVIVNPDNVCAVYQGENNTTTLLFAGGNGENEIVVRESVETVKRFIEEGM